MQSISMYVSHLILYLPCKFHGNITNDCQDIANLLLGYFNLGHRVCKHYLAVGFSICKESESLPITWTLVTTALPGCTPTVELCSCKRYLDCYTYLDVDYAPHGDLWFVAFMFLPSVLLVDCITFTEVVDSVCLYLFENACIIMTLQIYSDYSANISKRDSKVVSYAPTAAVDYS